LDLKVLLASKESEELKDWLDHKDLPEKLEVQETQDLQVHPENQVQLE